jgi:hypothetical protein
MENCYQIRVIKKPLLNDWCTFTKMHNDDPISYSCFLLFLLILRPKSFVCKIQNTPKWMKIYMLLLLILFVLQFSNKLCTLCMKTLQGREGFKSIIN